MFFAHLPAGYLVSRCLNRGGPKTHLKWTLVAGMLGGIFPDVDLLYLYLLDATPQHHHTYWTHLPIAWLGLGLLTWLAARHRDVAFRQALAAFLLGWLSHLLLDSLTGDIWWLYPLIDQPYSLAHVDALYQPWWMNFMLHWSMALELAIIAFAIWLEQASDLKQSVIEINELLRNLTGLIHQLSHEALKCYKNFFRLFSRSVDSCNTDD